MVGGAAVCIHEHKGCIVNTWQNIRILLLAFGLLLMHGSITAQSNDSVTITGQIITENGTPFKTSQLQPRLIPFTEDEHSLFAPVSASGSFEFRLPVSQVISFYDLKYRNYRMSLLLTPAEKTYRVIIKVDEQQEVTSMKINGSDENDAYRVYRHENAALKDMLRDIKSECAATGNNCQGKLYKLTATHNEVMNYLKISHANTYTANVLAGLGSIEPVNNNAPALAQLQAGFFSSTNFADTNLYRTIELNNKLQLYLDNVADTNAMARLKFIKQLMGKTTAKSEAQKHLLSALLDNFLDDYREPYLQSLVQWAAAQHSLAADQPVLEAKIKLVAGALPGKPAPGVSGEDTSGKNKTLLETARANRLTLLIFWESECPHCRKAMPVFINLYKQYHAKGLEVFAASLDNDKDKWKQFISENQLTWTNIVLPAKSTVHSDYFIQYTPTVVLVNQQGKIISRFIGVDDLDAAIAGILK